MGRPRKEVDEWKQGNYSVTKPHDYYVVRLGDDVVYANVDADQINKYLDAVSPKK